MWGDGREARRGEGSVLSPRLWRKERSLGRRGLCTEKTTDGFRWSIGLRKAVWEKRPNTGGEWATEVAGCLCALGMSPDIHAKEVWNNSLPSTIGDIPSSGQAAVLSIASRMHRGAWQWRQAQDSRAMRRRHIGRRLQRFFGGNLIPRF